MRVKDLIELYNKMNHYGRANGMELKVIEPGTIEYRMTVREDHLATPLAAHGGTLAGFMDAILGVASLSAVAKDDKLVSTLEFKINYLLPARPGDVLIGNGRVDHQGKVILTASGEITNENGDVLAKGLGTFRAYPFEKSGIKELL